MSSKIYQLPNALFCAAATLATPSLSFWRLQPTQKTRRRGRLQTNKLGTIVIGLSIVALLIVPAARALSDAHNSALSPQAAQAATPPSPPINTFPLKGINIGNDQSSTPNLPYQSVENAADLASLKGKVSRIRIALAYGLDQNDVNNLKRLAIAAKQQGFYVQFGITAGSDPDVNTYYNQWLSTDVISMAQWAQANRIDEFAIGNEEDWYCEILDAFTAKTPKEIRDDVRAEALKVRAVYSGSIVYADAEGTLDDWIKEGIGSLDRIYFNVYDSLPNFQSVVDKIAQHFGAAHGGVAEWSAEHGYNDLTQAGMTPQQYAQQIADREKILMQSGMPSYLFTLRMAAGGDDWGFILPDGTKRPGLDEFLNS